MRVLHIGKYYAPQRGGMERHVQDVSEWLVDNGVEIGVLVHERAGAWRSSRSSLNGVAIRRAGCIGAPLYAPISPTFPLQLSRALDAFEPQLLHLHMPNPSCFAVLASPRARRLPWVVHWHADVSAATPHWALRQAYRVYRPFEQALLAGSKAIVATSQRYVDASDSLQRWRSKVRVIALGIDEAARTDVEPPAWPSGGTLNLLAVGRLSHYKGFGVLIEAVARLPDVRLLLVGDGECAALLADRITTLGLHDRVMMVRDLEDDALHAAYRAADLFVLPSLDRSEAFGIVLLEAMRAGLPVVASDIAGSGVGHVVADGKTGVLVPPGNIEALAAAIARLVLDPERRQRFGAAGHARWQAHFTLDRSAQAVLDLYREIAG